MGLFKPPVGTDVKVSEVALNAEKFDLMESNEFATNSGTSSLSFKIDTDNSGPVLENVSGKLGVKTSDDILGTVKANTIEFESGYLRLKETDSPGVHSLRIYGDRDDTIASLYCANIFSGCIYLGETLSSPSIYDTFMYWPDGDDTIVESSIPLYTPGLNEIRDNTFPTDTTLWDTTTTTEDTISNISTTIIESGWGMSNTRKISCTYTNDQYIGGKISHSHEFPEASTSWLQGKKYLYARVTEAATCTGLTISIDGDPYGIGYADTDVSGWTLNTWNYIEITDPILPYDGFGFESVNITLNIPSNSPTGTYAFEIAEPNSLGVSIKEWIPSSTFATAGHTHTYVTGPEGATAGNFPILDVTGKILSDSTYAPSDFATVEHTHQTYTTYHGSAASAPSEPAAGDEYYDTDDSKFYKYNGTDWIALN